MILFRHVIHSDEAVKSGAIDCAVFDLEKKSLLCSHFPTLLYFSEYLRLSSFWKYLVFHVLSPCPHDIGGELKAASGVIASRCCESSRAHFCNLKLLFKFKQEMLNSHETIIMACLDFLPRKFDQITSVLASAVCVLIFPACILLLVSVRPS